MSDTTKPNHSGLYNTVQLLIQHTPFFNMEVQYTMGTVFLHGIIYIKKIREAVCSD